MNHDTELPQIFRSSLTPDTQHLQVDRDGVLLSEESAQMIFDELKNNDEFFWEYTDDGCLARAHKMCAILHKLGVFCEKIRADNAHTTWLRSFGISILKEDNKWLHMNFHMAVLVKVAISTWIEDRVIDPALFDGPVSVETWLGKLVNRDSIKNDGTVDISEQQKDVTRLPFDVFERYLFWEKKDSELRITNQLLQLHRKDFEKRQ